MEKHTKEKRTLLSILFYRRSDEVLHLLPRQPSAAVLPGRTLNPAILHPSHYGAESITTGDENESNKLKYQQTKKGTLI